MVFSSVLKKRVDLLRISRVDPTCFEVGQRLVANLGSVLVEHPELNKIKLQFPNGADNFAVTGLLHKELSNAFVG